MVELALVHLVQPYVAEAEVVVPVEPELTPQGREALRPEESGYQTPLRGPPSPTPWVVREAGPLLTQLSVWGRITAMAVKARGDNLVVTAPLVALELLLYVTLFVRAYRIKLNNDCY